MLIRCLSMQTGWDVRLISCHKSPKCLISGTYGTGWDVWDTFPVPHNLKVIGSNSAPVTIGTTTSFRRSPFYLGDTSLSLNIVLIAATDCSWMKSPGVPNQIALCWGTRCSHRPVTIRWKAKAGLLNPVRTGRPVFSSYCRRQDRCMDIYVWHGLHYMFVRFSTFFLHFGEKTLFYTWKSILDFFLKPLVSKDSLVLKISQLLLKSFYPHDLNRVGQEPWNRWYACLLGVWITPVYTVSTPYFCNSSDSKSEWNG